MLTARWALLLVAGIACCYFIAAAPTEGNWQLPLGVMMLALFGYFTLPDWVEERRAELADERASQETAS